METLLDGKTIRLRKILLKSNLTVEKNYVLPFGFVQSPILASLCLAKSSLGRCISELPKKIGGIVTSVYVDDIIMSCDDETKLHQAMAEVKPCAIKSGFILNSKKEIGPASKITAFNIELSNHCIEVESTRYADFMDAFAGSESDSERKGIKSYINSVNPVQARIFSST